MKTLNKRKSYRNILILESRDWWESCSSNFDIKKDVVLTFDLGLKRVVENLGGNAFYIDHLIDNKVMQKNNFLVYDFFKNWHYDVNGNDIFTYREIPFGFAFRIELWNDLVFYTRMHICLEKVKTLNFQSLHVGTDLGLVESILKEMSLPFKPVSRDVGSQPHSYYFPIHRWMDERVRKTSLKKIFVNFLFAFFAVIMPWVDRIFNLLRDKRLIFIQDYYPTRKIIQHLQKDSKLFVLMDRLSKPANIKKLFTERPIPVWGFSRAYQKTANKLLQDFSKNRCSKLILSNGTDISENIYRIIEKRISERMNTTLRSLDCIINYLNKYPVSMEVMIANVGMNTTLVNCVLKNRGVPSYLIINGILGKEYLDEAKYATMINSYSDTIKNNYFRGMSNVVTLGDPRMDDYSLNSQSRRINRENPTVMIGASGHSNVDLNSYLAVEFEFMYDILKALSIIKAKSIQPRIVIKVRGNGYIKQYQEFVKEYFPGLVDEILDNVSIRSILKNTDFYISIYSQTLFEASCLGIPCLYYKKDNEIHDPPFNGKSELVSVDNVDDLVKAIKDFQSGSMRYDSFLKKSVMEKYIGPLDGKNLERNVDFIYGLLEKSKKEKAL